MRRRAQVSRSFPTTKGPDHQRADHRRAPGAHARWTCRGAAHMSSEMYSKMRQNPKFQELVKRRGRFAAVLSAIVLVVFYGYILVVAFSPATLAQPVSEGSTLTVGILAELSMFVGFWVLVALYVRRANGEFDALTADIIKDAQAELAAQHRGVA
jgi:uncharacterized membrane protein (DUF485 family)